MRGVMMPNYSDLELQRLLEQAYGVGAADMAAIPAAPDPRVNELYEAWQMEQYDATIAQIVNDPVNADISPARLHQFVVAAGGDFAKAVQMCRDDAQQVLAEYGHTPGAAPLPGEAAAAGSYQPDPNASPKDNLHRAIEAAAQASRKGR